MAVAKFKVSDSRGKYAPKVYEVDVGDKVGFDRWVVGTSAAVKNFIRDNNHPPYQVGKSYSRYHARFGVVEVPS